MADGLVAHESFLVHAGQRYLKLAVALTLIVVLLYAWHDPIHGANGGTWLGYTLGGLSASLVLWLAWFGIRKRRYINGSGTVKGWLSAHVYLGMALLVIATLHTGFQFSLNFHLLLYLLLVSVVVSGIYGIVVYARYPQLLTQTRRNQHPVQMAQDIQELDDRALAMADKMDAHVHDVVLRSIGSTHIARTWREMVFGLSKKEAQRSAEAESELRAKRKELAQSSSQAPAVGETQMLKQPSAGRNQATMFFMASQMVTEGRGANVEQLAKLMEVLNKKKSIVKTLNSDIQQRARLQIWLYLHVPLSIALIAALVVHVITVFLYR